jgi:Methyltransferase domain
MPALSRRLKETLKSILQGGFLFGQRLGVNVLPNHFYSAIPDILDLKQRSDWRAPLSMIGVAVSIPEMLHADAAAINGEGSGYGLIEADFLYAFILRHRPARIIQIGCGVSTAIILRAGEVAGYKPDITCIEPFPTAYLRDLAAKNLISLRHEAAQVTPLVVFEAIAKGDLFFVDSTHTVKVGSEVNRIILEILPRLAAGAWVHFHDITFPYDYPRDVFGSLFLNSESTLLHAFLAGNSRYSIAASLSMLHYAEPARFKVALERFEPQGNQDGLVEPGGQHFPSSTWLKVH